MAEGQLSSRSPGDLACALAIGTLTRTISADKDINQESRKTVGIFYKPDSEEKYYVLTVRTPSRSTHKVPSTTNLQFPKG